MFYKMIAPILALISKVALGLALVLLAAPSASLAQSITYDFDKDGRAETVTVINGGIATDEDFTSWRVGLRIDRPGRSSVISRNIGEQGETSGPVQLEVSSWGSLIIRTKYHVADDTVSEIHDTLTIAYRQNDYRVIVYSFRLLGTRTPGGTILCGMNLMTGSATAQYGNSAPTAFRGPIANLSLSRWATSKPRGPRQCQTV